jgi:hypothetical protein
MTKAKKKLDMAQNASLVTWLVDKWDTELWSLSIDTIEAKATEEVGTTISYRGLIYHRLDALRKSGAVHKHKKTRRDIGPNTDRVKALASRLEVLASEVLLLAYSNSDSDAGSREQIERLVTEFKTMSYGTQVPQHFEARE